MANKYSAQDIERQLTSLRGVYDVPDQTEIAMTDHQLSILATIPKGSVYAAKSRGELKALYAGRNIYRAGDVKQFCRLHAMQTAQRLAAAAALQPATELSDPAAMVTNFFRQLIEQK